MKHELSLKSKIIYVSYINQEAHRWLYNVSETTYDYDTFCGHVISSKPYNNVIKGHIGENTQTPQMKYTYQYSEMTLCKKECFL